MRSRRRSAAAVAAVLVIGLTACAPALPESVVPGTKVVVGWTGELTSTNAAAAPSTGNIDVAAMMRGRFGDVVDGEFVADEGFGTVEILEEEPFTVRYDLAEPAWSDGTPLDAADLLLGWAGAAGYFPGEDDAEADTDAEPDAVDADVPSIDEFARSIDVTYAQPVGNWQSAVTVPVPAHVVGARALGIDDPMEAKQAVITAIQETDDAALAKIAAVWNEDFELADGSAAADVLLSSGPFLVDAETLEPGEGLTFVPNPEYRGPMTAQVARVELVPPGEDPLAGAGEALDVVRVAPVAANEQTVRDLERKDFVVQTTDDGTMWAMLLNPSGMFSSAQARTAFIHAAPQHELTDPGAGVWTASYASTTSMLAAPESRAYNVVNEDSGFTQTLGASDVEPEVERAAAGIPAGAGVCVLYDRGSEFATGAFTGLRAIAAESGWNVIDCGSDDFDAALEQRGWNAVIARVPIPQSPAQISAQWGSAGTSSITRHVDPERDELITQLAQTTDIYEARDVRAQIEATIVRAAVALPLTANPVLTVVDRDVTSVSARNGAFAPLTWGAAQWASVP